MKDRGTKNVNVQLSEPDGAFVGTEPPGDDPTAVPRWSKGKTRVSGDNFHASGDSAATSVKAARTPTHWRRGGFVTHYADGGGVKKTPNFNPGGQKGKLHRELGIPESEKIPAGRLSAAANSKNSEVRRDAIRAQTMKKWHHGK